MGPKSKEKQSTAIKLPVKAPPGRLPPLLSAFAVCLCRLSWPHHYSQGHCLGVVVMVVMWVMVVMMVVVVLAMGYRHSHTGGVKAMKM